MEFPEPVIDIAIEPKTKADQDKLGASLQKLAIEDPSFRVRTDEETGQTIIAGMGELHLEIIVDRLLREFKVEANVGKPQVAYRETITETVEAEGKYIRQSGGKGQYGHVWLRVGPNEPGKGFDFENEIVGGTVPKEFIAAVEKGVAEAMQTGRARRLPDGRRARSRPSTAASTTSTRARWPSRSPARWPSRRRAARPARCCSSRSWTARWSPPRSSWATSSAT